jgi:hypothetical protein
LHQPHQQQLARLLLGRAQTVGLLEQSLGDGYGCVVKFGQ